jgi:hypothetical protein
MLNGKLSIQWGEVPLRLVPSKAEVRFYGITFTRFGIGVIRHSRHSSGDSIPPFTSPAREADE